MMAGGFRTGCGSGLCRCCLRHRRTRWAVTGRGCPTATRMNAILLVLRTGMQWNALDVTGICSFSAAHRRFQEWQRAGVFHEIWRQGLWDYATVVGIDWAWLACEGAIMKVPLGGAKTGPNPTDRAKKGRSVRFSARPAGCRSGWSTTVPAGTTPSC